MIIKFGYGDTINTESMLLDMLAYCASQRIRIAVRKEKDCITHTKIDLSDTFTTYDMYLDWIDCIRRHLSMETISERIMRQFTELSSKMKCNIVISNPSITFLSSMDTDVLLFVMKWLNSETIIDTIIMLGWLEGIKTFHEHGNVIKYAYIKNAAKRGYVECVKYMVKHVYTKDVCDMECSMVMRQDDALSKSLITKYSKEISKGETEVIMKTENGTECMLVLIKNDFVFEDIKNTIEMSIKYDREEILEYILKKIYMVSNEELFGYITRYEAKKCMEMIIREKILKKEHNDTNNEPVCKRPRVN